MEDRILVEGSDKQIIDNEVRLIESKNYPFTTSDRELIFVVGDATQNEIRFASTSNDCVSLLENKVELDETFYLSVFHINDLHGHLASFNDQSEEAVFSRIKSALTKAHKKAAENPHYGVLTITAGDDCIGGLFDILLDETMTDNPIHATYQAYSHAGVDLSLLGNHDFDFGVENLANAIKRDAKFPILAANLRNCPELDGLYYPSVIYVIKGIRIGVIGLVTSAETKINNEKDCIVNPVPVAKRLVNKLDSFCDVIILVTHLGFSSNTLAALTTDIGDIELAGCLKNKCVQLIIGGHSHDVLNQTGLLPQNIINGIPVVQAGSMGHYLGRVDIHIKSKNATVTDARLITTKSLPVDIDFDTNIMQPLIEKARKCFSRNIGIVEDDPQLSTDFIRNNLASGEMALSNFITDGLAHLLKNAGQPVDLVMIDSSSIQQGLDYHRQITIGDWFGVMPFSDTIRYYQLTGEDLYKLLRDNAQRINRPDEPNTERGFLHFSCELVYKIKLGQTRCKAQAFEIEYQGMVIQQHFDKLFIIASTNFVRQLSRNWELCDDFVADCDLLDLNQFPHFETDYFLRRELIQYILEVGGVTQKAGATLDGRLQVVKNH